MAKSLRSKRRRKMRSVKRESYSKKELDRLKGMIKQAKEDEKEGTELIIVKKKKSSKRRLAEQPMQAEPIDDETMDTSKPKPKVDPTTLKTEHGNYPVWMNQRKINKKKKELKKIAKEKARKKRRNF